MKYQCFFWKKILVRSCSKDAECGNFFQKNPLISVFFHKTTWTYLAIFFTFFAGNFWAEFFLLYYYCKSVEIFMAMLNQKMAQCDLYKRRRAEASSTYLSSDAVMGVRQTIAIWGVCMPIYILS